MKKHKSGRKSKYYINKEVFDKLTELSKDLANGKERSIEDMDELFRGRNPKQMGELVKALGSILLQIRSQQIIKENLFFSVVEALTEAIDAKSGWTAGHSRRVTEYAIIIAEEMGLEPEQIRDLKMAAVLHDVGKIGISEKILEKTKKLSIKEREAIRKHPAIGAKILKHIKELSSVVEIIEHHHERMDGDGYPHKLKDRQIPLLSRIVAVADAYESMTAHNRPYQKKIPVKRAAEVLVEGKGRQWDPEVVDAFLKALNKRSKKR